MSQKNPVFKKLAALTLSASVCTTAVGATKPAKKEQSNNNIIKYVGCAVVAGVAIGTATYLAWAKLFVNKVLAAAEHLAKELNKEEANQGKVKSLSMKFYELLHEAIDETETQEEKIGINVAQEGKNNTEKNKEVTNQFGQKDYGNYHEKETCREEALALIEAVFATTAEKKEEIEQSEAQASEVKDNKIKVNRLRWADRDKLEEALKELFQEKNEERSDEKSKTESVTSSESSSSTTSTSSSSQE